MGVLLDAASCAALRNPPEATPAETADAGSPTAALTRAVARADRLLQMGGEELQQQESALEGWLAAARDLRLQNKISDAVFASRVASTMQQKEASVVEKETSHELPFETASGQRGSTVEQLCCLTALKTWCAELQLRSLPRAAFGAHCLLFLLTSASPNPNSAAATAAKAAVSAAAQAALAGPQAECHSAQQPSEQPSTRRSGRQQIQLTPVGEAVLNAHPLSSHFVLEGVTKALCFFFEAQHYDSLHNAGLSLQGAASALLLAEAVTRRRMQQYRLPGGSCSSKQKAAVVFTTRAADEDMKDGALQPLPDKNLLQRCCSCLLLCMRRYQDHLYKSPIAASSLVTVASKPITLYSASLPEKCWGGVGTSLKGKKKCRALGCCALWRVSDGFAAWFRAVHSDIPA